MKFLFETQSKEGFTEEYLMNEIELYKRLSEEYDKGHVPKVCRILTCCGEDLILFNNTNTCPICGADYNMSGDRLAPREQWGEETGEYWQDSY